MPAFLFRLGSSFASSVRFGVAISDRREPDFSKSPGIGRQPPKGEQRAGRSRSREISRERTHGSDRSRLYRLDGPRGPDPRAYQQLERAPTNENKLPGRPSVTSLQPEARKERRRKETFNVERRERKRKRYSEEGNPITSGKLLPFRNLSHCFPFIVFF